MLYKPSTNQWLNEIPPYIDGPNGRTNGPKLKEMTELGWVEIDVPFTTPEGSIRLHGTRRAELIGGQWHEIYDVETIEDYDARMAAAHAEWEAQEAAREAAAAEAAAAAFGAEVQAFLAGNDGQNLADLVQFFTILQTNFPTIELPTTYTAAQQVMSDVIETANTPETMVLCNRLQNKSRIAQDIYNRMLAPAGWTGAKLASMAQVLAGGS